MMFQKKVDRAMKWLKEKRNKNLDELEPKEYNNIELEKNDFLALIISALMVFGPIILILIIILRWALKS